MNFAEFRPWFDERFSLLLEEKINSFSKESTSTDVFDIAQYAKMVATGGKRFRPYLSYVALGTSDPDEHFELFASVELLHVFALIHDDIMDNGTTRHGVVCAQRFFAKQYGGDRIGEGLATLLGDLVYQWSYESMFSYTRSHPKHAGELIDTFAQLIREVIHGQMLDVLSPVQVALSEDLIIQKMYLKTARYSFVQPMRLGYIAGGTIDQHSAFTETYGRALGLMFQLQDDLLDVTEGHDKSSFLDVETNQQTLLSWYMRTKVAPDTAGAFAGYLGRALTADDRHQVAQILEHSGARAYVLSEIDR
ncbi:MAG: polyprenyl synthetase family protein, partial [Candidatus Pacebacteria bacterium]|nr:polyprenyl synthetase family protein [Candidatus Paceibacterota bacterium]